MAEDFYTLNQAMNGICVIQWTCYPIEIYSQDHPLVYVSGDRPMKQKSSQCLGYHCDKALEDCTKLEKGHMLVNQYRNMFLCHH